MALKTKSDEKGIKKLVSLAIIGSAIVVTIYSVYYYSQSHKYTNANIINQEQKGLQVAKSFYSVIDSNNIIYSPVLGQVFKPGVNNWPLQTLNTGFKNTWVGKPYYFNISKSGRIQDGVLDSIQNNLRLKYQAMPPLQFDPKKHDYIVQSIHVQHFELPYHVMMYWDNKDLENYPFRRYQRVITDSIADDFLLFDKADGFAIKRPEFKDELIVYQMDSHDEIATLSSIYQKAMAGHQSAKFKSVYLRFPIIDFALSYNYKKLVGKQLVKDDDTCTITRANGQLKILVGPDLRLNPSYKFNLDGIKEVSIKPPFAIILKTEQASQPYFMSYVSNNDLLLK